MCDKKNLEKFQQENLNYEKNEDVNFKGFDDCSLITCIDFLKILGKKMILVEAGPSATKPYYENLFEYDFNPIDTLYVAHLVEPALPETSLGPVFANLDEIVPYYSRVHSTEPIEDKESGSTWVY